MQNKRNGQSNQAGHDLVSVRKMNSAGNNAKQRNQKDNLGGVTGRGFMPGKSGNPKGRPPTRGLLNALKTAIAEVGPDGRSVEELLADALVEEALHGRNRLPAIQTIFDRLEGRPRQQIEVNRDQFADLARRSDADLEHYIAHGCWPDQEEQPGSNGEGGVM